MQRLNELDLYLKVLRNQAQYIMTTDYEHYTVILYSWKEHFIEQYYDNELEVTTKIVMSGNDDIDKFLKEVSLGELF